ncbi:MAG TPA: ABC transporter permease subunit, partial [Candidatus Dormibacteraeota bacterium]|nr:ABC transporter permease subunit [Candidatus Dormibacteraeota bacterium]
MAQASTSLAPAAAADRRFIDRLAAVGRWPLLGLLPFAVYALLLLGWPLWDVVIGAFKTSSGHFTLSNLATAATGVYRLGFLTSLYLSVVTSIVPGIIGFLVAYAVHTSRHARLLRRLVLTASGVFANFGGVPLAFLFISALGSSGLATGVLTSIGFNPYQHGFNLYGFWGVAIVYMYFQIPLMVVVVTPALNALRPQWREASASLGAGSWAFWRHVGAPILAPPVLGAILLLFGGAMSAYATADALTSGSIPLV